MSISNRRLLRENTSEPPPPTVELIAMHTHQMERSRQLRDAAITQARREKSATLHQIATAAGLSVSRVKQIDLPTDPRAKLKSPVTDVDLSALANSGGDPNDERVLSLDDVDPYLSTWPSERAFIQDDEEHRTPFMDLFWDIYDGEPTETWHLRYCRGSKELYAWTDRAPDPTYTNDTTYGGGAASGPCVLLGHVFSWDLVESCIDRPLRHVAHRPGGLAWAYGRVQLLNRALSTLSRDYSFPAPEALLTYLTDTLPESEQPR